MDQAPTRILFFSWKCFFFCVCCLLLLYRKMERCVGVWGLANLSIYLFLDFFNLTTHYHTDIFLPREKLLKGIITTA